MDGRKFGVRSSAAIATFITIAGLQLTAAGSASAAQAPRDDSNVASARARAERLAHQADVVGTQHDHVQVSLAKARKKLHALSVGIEHQRRTTRALQAELAGMAEPSDGYADDVVPGTNAAPAAQRGTTPSTLLTNVVVVSEDTDGLAQQMTASDERLTNMPRQQDALRRQVSVLDEREGTLAARTSRSLDRADAAEAHVTDLMGGPAVAYALSKVGNGYVFGAAGPSVFDCSGLTMASWAQAGVSLPHNSAAQYSSGRHISESELQPGDLVFYYSPISHVGMYIGNGKIVNALNPGAGVVISGLHDMPYVGAVRPG